MFVQDYSLENEAIGSQSSCVLHIQEMWKEIPKDLSPAFHAEKYLKIISTQ